MADPRPADGEALASPGENTLPEFSQGSAAARFAVFRASACRTWYRACRASLTRQGRQRCRCQPQESSFAVESSSVSAPRRQPISEPWPQRASNPPAVAALPCPYPARLAKADCALTGTPPHAPTRTLATLSSAAPGQALSVREGPPPHHGGNRCPARHDLIPSLAGFLARGCSRTGQGPPFPPSRGGVSS